jgi:type III restriction enzyme
MIDELYYFYGYDKSIFDYVKFDAYTEKQLADYLDGIIAKGATSKPFWIKNERNIYFSYGNKKYYPDYIVCHNDTIYIVEVKAEIYSDIKKNILLKQLDTIPGYKSILVFSSQLDELEGEKGTTFDDFIKVATGIYENQRYKEELIENPPKEEKYIKFLPVYSVNSLRKINDEKVKPEGWKRVEDGEYAKTTFITKIHGAALLPKYRHGDWIVLNKAFDKSKLEGKVVLVELPERSQEYGEKITIRKLLLKKKEGYLIPTYKVCLQALNDEKDVIELEKETIGTDINVLAVLEEDAG